MIITKVSIVYICKELHVPSYSALTIRTYGKKSKKVINIDQAFTMTDKKSEVMF